MISICLIFLALSFGTLVHLSLGISGYNLQIAEIVILFIFLFTLEKMTRKNIKIYFSPYKILFCFLWFLCFIYSIFTYFWSDQGVSVLAGSIGLFYGLITFFVAEYYFKENPRIFITANRLFIISLLIQIALNMLKGIQAGEIGFYALKYNSITLLGNSNYISIFFTFGLIYEFITKEKKSKIFVLINLIGIILTLSRGAIVSITCALLVYFIIALFNKNIKITKTIISFVLLLFMFYLFINYTIPGMEFWKGLELGLGASSVSSRLNLWQDAIKQITTHPFGNGIVWKNETHNVVLSSFKNLGVGFGLIYLLLISFPLFHFFRRKIFRLSNISIAVLLAYLTVFIHSMFEVFYFGTTSIIWTAMVLPFIFKTIEDDNIL